MIMLMRHAKSSHGQNIQKDIDRPLTEQGYRDAQRMGAFVKQAGVLPAHIKSSTAQRARQTTELFTDAAEIDASVISWNEDLYYGGARDYLKVIQEASEHVDRIMLVGHNPLLEEIVSLLCNGEGAFVSRVPSGGLVCIEHPAIKWKQIKAGTARIQWMVIPGLLQKIIEES